MRDSLQIKEIEDILSNHLDNDLYDAIMSDIKDEAGRCLCCATEYDECACGAWELEDSLLDSEWSGYDNSDFDVYNQMADNEYKDWLRGEE